MRLRPRRLLVGLVCALATLAAAPGALAHGDRARTYYVSLGDSLAVGGQPVLGETDEGYADQLHAALRVNEPKQKLVKFGCSGESTTSMLEGSQLPEVAAGCGTPAFYRKRYKHRTQLADATAFLHAHRKSVRLVTINVGANDVLGPGGPGEIAENLPAILAELRAAAGPGVPIVAMNYYSAFLPDVWQQGGLPALQAFVVEFTGLNDFLESFYAAAGVPVADVESAFLTTDLTLVGGVPRNVLQVCSWTWMCVPPPFGPDVHPNAAGYAAITQAFLDVLPPS